MLSQVNQGSTKSWATTTRKVDRMNSSASHRTRTAPERYGPIRSAMATLRPPRVPGNPPDVVSAAGSAVFGMLENGVRTAYAVIDDYLRRGQETARGLFNDSNRRGYMTDDRVNPGSGFGTGAGFGPGGPFGTMNPMALMTQWMQVMQAWTQFWFSMMQSPNQQSMMGMPFMGVPGMPGVHQARTATHQSEQAGARQSAAPASTDVRLESVTVAVTSFSQAECTVNVTPGSYVGLVCDPLRPSGFQATPIDAPTINYQGGTLRAAIKVPNQQAVGRYTGLVRSLPDQFAVGDITVVIPITV